MQEGHTIKVACQRVNNNGQNSDKNNKLSNSVETTFQPNSGEYEKFRQIIEKYYKISSENYDKTELDNITKLDDQLGTLISKDDVSLSIKGAIHCDYMHIEGSEPIENDEFNNMFDCQSYIENLQADSNDYQNYPCPSLIFINDMNDHNLQIAFLGNVPEIIEV